MFTFIVRYKNMFENGRSSKHYFKEINEILFPIHDLFIESENSL